MPEVATFRLTLRGGLAERHLLEGHDGYNALAGAAWAMSLVTNYVETGRLRWRGDFIGRHAVLAEPLAAGSLIAEFKVALTGNVAPALQVPSGTATSLLYGLMRRVIHRNIGLPTEALNAETEFLIDHRSGDVEALVARTEPSIRRAHEAIGNTATSVDWVGGFSAMGSLTPESKEYMKATIPDDTLMRQDVTVSGFYGNNGNGLIFDPALGRNIPISMSPGTLASVGVVFSYGLDQYMNKTGNTIRIQFTRKLASDGRPKLYVIKHAAVNKMLSR